MDYVELAGRLVFAGLFLYYGVTHFTQHEGFSAYARAVGVPFARAAVAATGVMLLVGGTLIALGAWADLGSLILVAFLVPVAFAVHPFWKQAEGAVRAAEQASFLKDVALAGAALTLFAFFRDGAALTLTGPLF